MIRARRRGVVLVALALTVGLAVPAAADAPDVSAAGAVLWDPADRRVLLGKQEQQARRPASTTKVMTVLLALEAGTVDDTVTVSERAVATGATAGAATLDLTVGQQIPMRSLLAGLVLRSGNDAAVAVAEHVAGSEDAFVERMNARARELDMEHTTFLNATGLTDDPAHNASPLDLALLAETAMRNDEFAEWAGASTLAIPGIGTVTSRNELLGRYPGATGVKTGYTNLAGLCLVASAQRDGRRLFAVVLDSADSFADTARLFDHGFDDFRRAQAVRRNREALTYRWAGGSVPVTGERSLGRTVAADTEAVWRAVMDPAVALPVREGAQLGVAELEIGGEVVGRTPLVAAEDADAPEPGAPGQAVGGAVADALRAFVRTQPVDRSA